MSSFVCSACGARYAEGGFCAHDGTRVAEVDDVLLGTGCTSERATGFVAHGMLLNVMLAMRAPEHLNESTALADLTECAFGEDGLNAAAAS